MDRNRERTEQELIDAVGAVVAEGGFAALGVNAVAARAGVAKMLIYRYFGSFDALLERWALQHSYWAEEAEAFFSGSLAGMSEREQVKTLFRRQIRSLRDDPLKREVLRWTLTSDHPVAGKVMERVEEQGQALHRHFSTALRARGDSEASIAILIGGLYYLGLSADRSAVFNGVALDRDEGWARIEAAAEGILERLLGSE